MNRRIIFILGMHRSGTSCLTGSLEEAGLHLGDVVQVAPFNKKGNRESRTVMNLNERLLQHNGGSWCNLPQTIKWDDEFRRERDAYIKSWLTQPVCGLKDPRMLLVLDFWLEALPNVTFVGTFRDPKSVVRSLRARPTELGSDEELLELWRRHNQSMLELWDSHAFPLVNFNSSPDSYERQIKYVARILGLPKASSANFFDPELRHQEADSAPLPHAIEAVYQSLIDRWKRGLLDIAKE